MNDQRSDEARQLMTAAERDRLSFHLLLETGRAPNETLGFLAQQACEKYLKALLALVGAQFDRSHDLDYLARLAIRTGIDLPVETERLRALNPYAVALRYEGTDVIWVTNEEATHLVEAMRTLANTRLGSGIA